LAAAKPVVETFDLNTADTTQLKSIYGIGSKLANRIISYREKLGGFHDPSQLYEVYALDSTVVVKLLSRSFIKPDAPLKKISVNTATEQQLEAHPYVSKRMARAIVTWRFQHGEFKELSELEKIVTIRDADLKKILPYLEL
jgi:DNA uptake protein ComE-like DNA-binding protein